MCFRSEAPGVTWEGTIFARKHTSPLDKWCQEASRWPPAHETSNWMKSDQCQMPGNVSSSHCASPLFSTCVLAVWDFKLVSQLGQGLEAFLQLTSKLISHSADNDQATAAAIPIYFRDVDVTTDSLDHQTTWLRAFQYTLHANQVLSKPFHHHLQPLLQCISSDSGETFHTKTAHDAVSMRSCITMTMTMTSMTSMTSMATILTMVIILTKEVCIYRDGTI